MDEKKIEESNSSKSVVTKEEIASIAKEFNKSLSALKDLPVPIDNDTSGIPIFNEEDVEKSRNKLDVLLRLLFVKYRVTRLRFARQFQKYAISVLSIPVMHINSQRENFLRAIRDGNITWNKFESVLAVILGLKMSKITIECVNLDGGSVSITAETDKVGEKNADKYSSKNPLGEEEKRET